MPEVFACVGYCEELGYRGIPLVASLPSELGQRGDTMNRCLLYTENIEGCLDGCACGGVLRKCSGDACQEFSSPDNARYQKILESRRDEPLQITYFILLHDHEKQSRSASLLALKGSRRAPPIRPGSGNSLLSPVLPLPSPAPLPVPVDIPGMQVESLERRLKLASRLTKLNQLNPA